MEPNSKAAKWTGWTLTALAALPFLASSAAKFARATPVLEGFPHFGWPVEMLTTVGVLELGSALLYLFPPTAVLGGIVLTGFLGGAIATHLRIGEAVYLHVVIGILIWLGLFLREPRLRVLIPILKKQDS